MFLRLLACSTLCVNPAHARAALRKSSTPHRLKLSADANGLAAAVAPFGAACAGVAAAPGPVMPPDVLAQLVATQASMQGQLSTLLQQQASMQGQLDVMQGQLATILQQQAVMQG